MGLDQSGLYTQSLESGAIGIRRWVRRAQKHQTEQGGSNVS
jgi:hypothetical protein